MTPTFILLGILVAMMCGVLGFSIGFHYGRKVGYAQPLMAKPSREFLGKIFDEVYACRMTIDRAIDHVLGEANPPPPVKIPITRS